MLGIKVDIALARMVAAERLVAQLARMATAAEAPEAEDDSRAVLDRLIGEARRILGVQG